jgi:hypothetical protein
MNRANAQRQFLTPDSGIWRHPFDINQAWFAAKTRAVKGFQA